MAAPTSSYLNNGDKIVLEQKDNAGTVITSFDAFVAAYIYDTANILTLFYLDAIVELEVKDLNGNLVRKGFIGLIINNPANRNYKQHNVSRHYKGRLDELFGSTWMNEYIALNDAGLNTRGITTDPTISSASVGNFQFLSNFKSSYYNLTTNYGFRWWLLGNESNPHIDPSGNTIVENGNTNYTGNPNYDLDTLAGQEVYVQAWIENEEGTSFSDVVLFIAKPAQLSLKYHSTTASLAFSGSDFHTVFVSTVNLQVGTRFYGDIDMIDDAVATGYYILDDNWYEVSLEPNGYSWIVASGLCQAGSWPAGDPANSSAYIQTEVVSNSFDQSEACSIWANNPEEPTQLIYQKISDGKYYTTNNGSTLVADSYWVNVDTGEWFQTIDGAVVDSGQC